MTTRSIDLSAATRDIIRVGRALHQRGSCPATSGNISVRLDGNLVAITVSGRHKGELTEDGVMRVDLDGNALDAGRRPSAETALHVQLYRRFPTVGCVLHTHSVGATVLSRFLNGDGWRLTGYELMKAFRGVRSHDEILDIPVLENSQNMVTLAQAVEARLDDAIPGYLLRGHGLYTWGQDADEAMRHVEAFETLMACELELARLRR